MLTKAIHHSPARAKNKNYLHGYSDKLVRKKKAFQQMLLNYTGNLTTKEEQQTLK
jgi:hypothetical protein